MRSIYFFLVFSVVLFAAALFIWWYSYSFSSLPASDSDFSVASSLEIISIEIQGESEGVSLEKDLRGKWILNGQFLANDLAVNQLTSAMTRLRVRQPVSIENREKVNEMLLKDGLLVRTWIRAWYIHLGGLKLLPHARLHQSFRVGEDTPDGQSTYMRKSASVYPFKVHIPAYEGGIAYLFDSNERAWRDPVIADIPREEVKSVKVSLPHAPQLSYLLMQEGDGSFAFYDYFHTEQKLRLVPDSARVVRFLSSFKDLHYESLLNPSQEEQRKKHMQEQPFMEIIVESTRGFQVKIEAFAREVEEESLLSSASGQDPNRFYVRVNEGEFALAQYYVFNRILRPLSFFEN